jgi:acyl-CoA reductase-like NAD-dependent aldehyde dehydrogenase
MALCIEAGKPIKDSRGEVTRLIDTFKVAAEESVRIDGEVLNLEISARARGYRGFSKRVPIGPVLVHLAVQLSAEPGRAQGCAGARGRLSVSC